MKPSIFSKLSLVAIMFVIASMVLSGCKDDILHPVYLRSPSEKPDIKDIVGVWRLHDIAIPDVKKYSETYMDDGFLLLKDNNTFIAHNLPKAHFDTRKIEYKNFSGTWNLVEQNRWGLKLSFINEKSSNSSYTLCINGDKPYFLIQYIENVDIRPCIVFTLESRIESYCQRLCAEPKEAQ
jgi:hypothetical protein